MSVSLAGLRSDSPLIQFLGLDGELQYPSDDGELMSDDTLHYEWIRFVYDAIREAFEEREDVFTAGNLLWYPVEGVPTIRRAPDTMVVFGRPKGPRSSWLQWEEDGLGPQFVVEVASKSNTEEEFREKLAFYDRYGVQEYLVYDYTRERLSIWSREHTDGPLTMVPPGQPWTSPLMGITFRLTPEGDLGIRLPDGRSARSREELLRDWRMAQQRAVAEQLRAEAAQQRAEAEQQRAEAEQQRAEAEQQRADRLAAKLRELGLDPDAL
jgi:Uma2 family endonuclease